MSRQPALLSIVTCWIVLAALGFWAGDVLAADSPQANAVDQDLPDVGRFDYLFHESPSETTGDMGEPATDESEAESADEGAADQGETGGEGILIPPLKAAVPYVPEAAGLSVSVDRGCGSTYAIGEPLGITTSIPVSGDLTVWRSTDGAEWRRIRGPMTVQQSTIPISISDVAYPIGNELLFARLTTPDGRQHEDVCHFYTVAEAVQAATPEPTETAIAPALNVPSPSVSTVEPEAASVEPETTTVEPETTTVEPEAASVKPEAATVEPQPAPFTYTMALQCDPDVPSQVEPDAIFSQQISVTNPSELATAAGVLFFAHINPTGQLPVRACHPNCNVTTGTLTASLGTLHPGQTKVVTIDGVAPDVPGTHFDLTYSVRGVGFAEVTCAKASFTIAEAETEPVPEVGDSGEVLPASEPGDDVESLPTPEPEDDVEILPTPQPGGASDLPAWRKP